MYFAIGVEPTNETALTFGWASNASTHSRPPCTMLKTPRGTPACSNSRAIIIAVSGTFSLGLSTNVFPQASATGYIQSGTIAGKLNGVMPTQTPRGWRIVSQSIPRATFSIVSPLSKEGTPQANSTISILRRTSPRDSVKVLPCSRVLQRVISSNFSSSIVLKRNSTRARSTGGVSHQGGNAASAASTASFTCAAVHIGVSAITSPVEGLYTGEVSTLRSSCHSPLTKTGQICGVFTTGN